MNNTFDVAEPDEQQIRVAQLAASHSLLDPGRRGSRKDLLVSSLVAALAARGELTSSKLFDAVRRMWRSEAIADAVLEQALIDARSSSLVTQLIDLDGTERYGVAEGASIETEHDRDFVSNLLSQFTADLNKRIKDFADSERLLPKAERITNLVITAVALASEGSYAVNTPTSSSWSRPIYVATEKIAAFASNQQPRSVREPVEQLALDALDPTDPFGNEIVHLVVVGALLHGLAAQRGVGHAPTLESTMLLLDTSTLISLASPNDDPGHRAIETLVELSVSCGANVIVAEHTLDEWERVWSAADAEEAGQRTRASAGLAPRLNRFVSNPFLAAYLAYRHDGGAYGWIRWQEGRRDIRPRLRGLGVNIEKHANEDQIDIDCYELIRDKLLDLSDDETIRARRTQTAAEADASSAAMIARWRRESGGGSAVFLARDSLTDRAFREVFDDSQPLVGNPEAWLLYVSNVLTDDRSKVVEVADLIADLAVRDTILSLASTHTLEEALDISEILLAGESVPSSREIRDIDDPTLFDALDELQQEAGQDVRVRATAVLQRRSIRNNIRASNREAIQTAELEKIEMTASELVEEEAARAERFRNASEFEKVRAESAEADVDSLKMQNETLRRSLLAGAVSGMVVIVFLVTTLWGFLGVTGFLVSLATLGLGISYGYYWVTNPRLPTGQLWASLASQVLLELVLAVAL